VSGRRTTLEVANARIGADQNPSGKGDGHDDGHALTDRPDAPACPPRLTPAQLRAAQAQTLDVPRRRYGVLARALFKATDLVYSPG
jgi:hypothetical protein